jgi:hypothetical protein
MKPAKVGGGKGLWFWVLSKKGRVRRLGNLAELEQDFS